MPAAPRRRDRRQRRHFRFASRSTIPPPAPLRSLLPPGEAKPGLAQGSAEAADRRRDGHVRARDPLPEACAPFSPGRRGVPRSLPPSLRGRGAARPRSPRGGTRRAPRAAALPLRTPPAPGGGQPAPPRHRPRAAAAANPRTGRGGPRSEGRGAAGLTHGGRVIDASGVAKFSPAGPRARRSGSRAREGAGSEPIERRQRRRAGARGYFWDTPLPAPPVVIRPNQI